MEHMRSAMSYVRKSLSAAPPWHASASANRCRQSSRESSVVSVISGSSRSPSRSRSPCPGRNRSRSRSLEYDWRPPSSEEDASQRGCDEQCEDVIFDVSPCAPAASSTQAVPALPRGLEVPSQRFAARCVGAAAAALGQESFVGSTAIGLHMRDAPSPVRSRALERPRCASRAASAERQHSYVSASCNTLDTGQCEAIRQIGGDDDDDDDSQAPAAHLESSSVGDRREVDVECVSSGSASGPTMIREHDGAPNSLAAMQASEGAATCVAGDLLLDQNADPAAALGDIQSEFASVFHAFEASGFKDFSGALAKLRALSSGGRASVSEDALLAALEYCAAVIMSSGQDSRMHGSALDLLSVAMVENERRAGATGRFATWVIRRLGGEDGEAAPRDKSARRIGAELLARLLPPLVISAKTDEDAGAIVAVAEKVLLRLCRDRSPSVRVSAVRALEEICPDSQAADTALHVLATTDTSHVVRLSAVRALARWMNETKRGSHLTSGTSSSGSSCGQRSGSNRDIRKKAGRDFDWIQRVGRDIAPSVRCSLYVGLGDCTYGSIGELVQASHCLYCGLRDTDAHVRRASELAMVSILQRVSDTSADPALGKLFPLVEALLTEHGTLHDGSPGESARYPCSGADPEDVAERVVRAVLRNEEWIALATKSVSGFLASESDQPCRRARALVWKVLTTQNLWSPSSLHLALVDQDTACGEGYEVSELSTPRSVDIATLVSSIFARVQRLVHGEVRGADHDSGCVFELRQLLTVLAVLPPSQLRTAGGSGDNILTILALAKDIFLSAPVALPFRLSGEHEYRGPRQCHRRDHVADCVALAVRLVRAALRLPACCWVECPEEEVFAAMIIDVLGVLWSGRVVENDEMETGERKLPVCDDEVEGMRELGARFDGLLQQASVVSQHGEFDDAAGHRHDVLTAATADAQAIKLTTFRALRIVQEVLSKTRVLEQGEVGPPGSNLLQEWLHPTLVRADAAEPLLGGHGWATMRSLAVRCMALLGTDGMHCTSNFSVTAETSLFFSAVMGSYGIVAQSATPGSEAGDAAEDIVATCVGYLTDTMLLSPAQDGDAADAGQSGREFFAAIVALLGPSAKPARSSRTSASSASRRQSSGRLSRTLSFGQRRSSGGGAASAARATASRAPADLDALPGRLPYALQQRVAQRLATFLLYGGAWVGRSGQELRDTSEGQVPRTDACVERDEAEVGAIWCVAWVTLGAFYRVPPASTTSVSQLDQDAERAEHRGRLLGLLICMASASAPHAKLCARAGEVLLSTMLWQLGADCNTRASAVAVGVRQWSALDLPRVLRFLGRQLVVMWDATRETDTNSGETGRGVGTLPETWLICLWRPLAILNLESAAADATCLLEAVTALLEVFQGGVAAQVARDPVEDGDWASVVREVHSTTESILQRWGLASESPKAACLGQGASVRTCAKFADRVLARIAGALPACLADSKESCTDTWRIEAESRRSRLRGDLEGVGVHDCELVRAARSAVTSRLAATEAGCPSKKMKWPKVPRMGGPAQAKSKGSRAWRRQPTRGSMDDDDSDQEAYAKRRFLSAS